MRRFSLAAALLLCGCASVQSAGLLSGGAAPNDVFLVEVSDHLPPAPYAFVSVSVVVPGRSGHLPERLPDDQVAEMKAYAASFGADQLVIERQETSHRKAFYGLGLRTTDPAGGGLKGLPACTHSGYAGSLGAARSRLVSCLTKAQARRPALKGVVRVLLLIDGLGGVYQAAVAPDSTRDGVMRGCGLAAAYETDFGRHGEVLCRAELQASL